MADIELGEFLKLAGLAESGGQAKWLVKGGEVLVNGEVELRRGRKLTRDDKVSFQGKNYRVGDFLPDA